ncbi:hypothetical protein [Hydrogenimonas sp.]
MKTLRKWPVLLFLCMFSTAGASGGGVWERATDLYGNKADRYLYLALPLKAQSGEALSPLVKDGKSYYVKRATYRVSVKDGPQKGSFDIRFSVTKRSIALRGVKNNLIVDLGEKEVVDIAYSIEGEDGKREYHNYFKTVPEEVSVRLFPGFLGSDLFGRVVPEESRTLRNLVGVSVKEGKRHYLWLDPSPFSKMGAKPYTEGDLSLLTRRTLLDGAASRWGFVSDLEIWNIFHYGLKRPKNRNFTGFLNIRFHVRPLAEKRRFGNVSLPFSDVGYEVNYKLSSEYAKAFLVASDYTFIPEWSRFLFKKELDREKIDLEIEIEIRQIAFEESEAL